MSIPGSLTPLFNSGSSAATPATPVPPYAGLQISRSLRFNSADSAYLSRTPAVAGNRQKWTWAGWVKRAKIGVDVSIFAISNGNGPVSRGAFYFLSDNTIRFWNNPSGFSETAHFNTTAVFRDPSAWYHLVFAFDLSNATQANRMKIYANG